MPRILALCTALLLLFCTSATAQQAGPSGVETSPRIGALAQALEAGRDAAEAAFWTELEASGTPLIEPIPQVPGHSLVTFVYRGGPDISEVRLASNLNALLIDGLTLEFGALGAMERVAGSDVWYLSFRLRHDVRVPYRFEVTRRDSTARGLDPLNPVTWEPDQRGLASSILEMPGAPPQPWREYSESDEGDWDAWEFDDGPDAGRTVYIYKPRSWSPDRSEPYPVLVGLGAFGHGIGMRVDRVVDHLIQTGRLAPMVVALADLEAGADTTRYRATTDFVADRFLPWLAERYNTSTDPEDVVLSGTSRRGMVASLVAFRRPDAAGNVVSLSGSYYWRPADEVEYEWVPHLYATSPPRPVRFYLTAGELETVVSPGNAGHYMVATNRHFRDVLTAAGYRLTYREFNGVHSELSWQDGLADGLTHLIGPVPR